MKHKQYIGIDLGTNSTGISIIDSNSKKKPTIFLIESPKKALTIEKVDFIYKAIRDLDFKKNSLIAIEKPFAIKGNAKVLLELFGIIKYLLYRRKHTIVEVAQTSLKKFATSSGNAKKSEMVLKAYKEFKIDKTEDEVDAFWLSKLAEALEKEAKESYRRDSIKKIKENKNAILSRSN